MWKNNIVFERNEMRIESNRFMGINTAFGQRTNKYDPKEAAVAKKLGMSVEEFVNLPEDEKAQKVQAYNKAHPDDKIEEKGKNQQPMQPIGNEMQQFHNDINWDNVKLE